MVNILTFLATGLALFAEGKYIFSILRGKTKPIFSGWFIFTLSTACVLISAYALGARESLFLIATFTLFHAVVMLLSLKFGIFQFTRTDITLLLLSLLGLFLWWQTSNPWYALILNICIDMLGYFAIAKKLYFFPGTEDTSAWMISIVAYGLNLMVISSWIPQEYLFSLLNVIWCFIIFLLTLRLGPLHQEPTHFVPASQP